MDILLYRRFFIKENRFILNNLTFPALRPLRSKCPEQILSHNLFQVIHLLIRIRLLQIRFVSNKYSSAYRTSVYQTTLRCLSKQLFHRSDERDDQLFLAANDAAQQNLIITFALSKCQFDNFLGFPTNKKQRCCFLNNICQHQE